MTKMIPNKKATSRIARFLRALWNGIEGQDLTEYALLIVLIALIGVVSIGSLGKSISDVMSNAAKNLTTTTT